MRNEKKIKVVEVIDRSFLGGGQRHILHLASRLNKHQFEVHVCSSSPGPFIHQVRARDLSHHSIQIGKASLCRSVTALKRLFSQESFDIVHTHGGVAGLVGRWAASRAGIPVIVHTLHGIHYLHYRNPIWKWLMMSQEKLLSRWTNHVICVSEADAQRVLHYKLVPPAKLSVIYNGVEWEETNNYLVGTVARLHRQKGLIYLFQSFPLIKEKIGNVVLVVVGGGPLEKRFRAFLRKKGWERQIHLLGEQDKVSDYSAFDLFVLPSLWEGLPLALLEAAQWELPVVATDIGGHREVISSGRNGLLVSPKDSHSLGEAIIWMNKHPHEAHQFGQELARDIYRRFNLQAMVARIEKIYLDLSK